MEITTTQEKILMTLRDIGDSATSKIAGYNSLDYHYCLFLLKFLSENKFIIKTVMGKSTYWGITKKGLLKLNGSNNGK